jgi:hypothetical protein
VVGHRAMSPKKRKVYRHPDRPVLNLFPTDAGDPFAGDDIDLQDRELGLSCVGRDGDEDGGASATSIRPYMADRDATDRTDNCICRPLLFQCCDDRLGKCAEDLLDAPPTGCGQR